MKNFILIFILYFTLDLKSQNDASVSASFTPSTLAIGSNIGQLEVIITNLSTSAASIPSGALSIQVDAPEGFYNFTSPPTGPASSLFTWTNPIPGLWLGINNVDIPAFTGGGAFYFAVTPIMVTPLIGATTSVNAFVNPSDPVPGNNNTIPGSVITATVLPVTYSNFQVNANDCGSPQLLWTTESESNNKGFNIERASDEGDYQIIGFIESHHNSTVKREYTFTDKSAPRNGNFKYRLDAVDYDGKKTLSDVVSAALNCFSETEVSLFPNPTTDRITVYFEDRSGETLEANILDQGGKSAMKTMVKANVKNNVSVATLPEGIYNLQIERNGIISSKRFIKVN